MFSNLFFLESLVLDNSALPGVLRSMGWLSAHIISSVLGHNSTPDKNSKQKIFRMKL